jgi:hypothetical protein
MEMAIKIIKDMYYIYHIEGVKIGCTKRNPKERVRAQKYSYFEILEEHSDIIVASNRERELQKQYGYSVDTIPYFKGKYSQNGIKRGLQCVETGYMKEFQKIGNKKSTEKSKKIILQYDLDGNFIKQWNCGVRNMPEEYKNAGGCAKSNTGTLYGFQWRYKISDDYPKQIEKFENKSFQKVIQKDLQGNVIKIWDNQTQASDSIGCSIQAISLCCRKINKTAKGFIWEKYA